MSQNTELEHAIFQQKPVIFLLNINLNRTVFCLFQIENNNKKYLHF